MTAPAPLLVPSFRERDLRLRIATRVDLDKLYAEIDRIPALTGAGVVYLNAEMTSVALRPFRPICRQKPVRIVLREQPREMSDETFRNTLRNNRADAKLVGYAVGTAASCGAAVLGWLVIVGSGVSAPLTIGTSTTVAVIGWSAAIASSTQCLIGLSRTVAEVAAPAYNDQLDSTEWFTTMETAIDVLSLVGASAAGVTTLKVWRMVRASSSRRANEILRGMTRPERRRMTEELARSSYPGLPRSAIKALMATGEIPMRLKPVEINGVLTRQLKDAIGASLSFGGSAASGTLQTIAVGIYQEVGD